MARAEALEKTLQQIAHDCGVDFVARLEPEEDLGRMLGEEGTRSLLGVGVEETDGLQRTDGDGVVQVAARARGLVGS